MNGVLGGGTQKGPRIQQVVRVRMGHPPGEGVEAGASASASPSMVKLEASLHPL